MKKACYGHSDGPEVTPEEFIKRATPLYKEKGIFPYCKACDQIVHVYGVHNPNPKTTKRFDHSNADPAINPLDDCILADRKGNRFKGLEPDNWDGIRGKQLRKEFFEDSNLRTAYGFCLNMCRKGNLKALNFNAMISRADKKKIWAYADMFDVNAYGTN